MSALSDEEKIKVRHHLGYLNVQEAQTFVLGTPAGVETQFLIEGAMNRLLAGAIPMVREILVKLDHTEEQMLCGQDLVEVNSLGEIQTNMTGQDRAQKQLRQAYQWWRMSLANLLGVPANPFDQRLGVMGFGGGISVPVRG